jgi:putative SOS response-associated peptidase YedK
MCGRFTNRLTWEEIMRLYRLTIKTPPHNLPPRYNIPTDPVDVVTERDGNRDFVRMRWGLVPSWRLGFGLSQPNRRRHVDLFEIAEYAGKLL